MASFKKVARVGDIPDGKGRLVMGLDDKPIALFHVGDDFYAVNYICPHMGGPIGEGPVRNYIVTCPWHGWSYDVRTGIDENPPGHDLSAYEVKVEGDVVSVGPVKKFSKEEQTGTGS
jgi:nitrite reductase (NADH) small subunit/3-phenylpropionate/trans-cinnamate dioxygenase ferredoxin subunit